MGKQDQENKKPEEDEPSDWEHERSKYLAALSDDELKFSVAQVVEHPFNGHAYNQDDLSDLRKILGLSDVDWPDELLHRHTDELAIFIGMPLQVARAETSKPYLALLQQKLLSPTNAFLGTLEDSELDCEYIQPWTPLKTINRQTLIDEVSKFKTTIEQHMAVISDSGQKGKSWDSELKDHFLRGVDYLCEYLNNHVEPKRKSDNGYEDHSQFGKCVILFARPIKWGSKQGSEITFDGAIRKYVDNYNAAIRKWV